MSPVSYQPSTMRLPAAAAGAVLHYLAETQKGALPHLKALRTFHTHEFMVLDDVQAHVAGSIPQAPDASAILSPRCG